MGPRPAISSQHDEGSLDSQLLVHRSQLEKDRDAALAEAAPRVGPRPSSASQHDEGSLGSSLLIHKSRLELMKEAAKAAAATAVAMEADASSRRSTSSGYEGPSLDEAFGTKRLSKLEKEKLAAKAAEAAGPAGGAVAQGGPKSKLQLEKAASAAADKARRAAQLLAAARAARAGGGGGGVERQDSLGSVLKPSAPSKLEKDRDAWLKAE